MGCCSTKHLYEEDEIGDLEALRMDTKLVSIANIYISYGRVPEMYLKNEEVAFGVEKVKVPRDLVRIPYRKSEYHLVIVDLFKNKILTRRQAGLLTQICCLKIPKDIKVDSEEIQIFNKNRSIMHILYEELDDNFENWRGILPLFKNIFEDKQRKFHIFNTTKFIMDRLYDNLGGNYEYWRGIVPLFEYIIQLEDVRKQKIVWANNKYCRRYADKNVNLVDSIRTKSLPVELVQKILNFAFGNFESCLQ